MSKSNWKLWAAVIAGLLVMTGALVGVKALQIGAMIAAGKTAVVPPESVTTARVEATDWQTIRPAVGTLVAVQGVTLASEVPGSVSGIFFDSGALVRKGARLVQLDTSVERARLQAAQAEAMLAEQSLERARKLRAGGNNSIADLDAARARAKQARANVAILRATIAKKTIRAPFDGRLGIRQVDLGQVLAAGAPIVTLQSVPTIYAEFMLPQQALARLRPGLEVRLTTDSFPDRSWQGSLTAIDAEVDVATRNVRLQATFPNDDGRLRDGMFVNLEVYCGQARRVLVIPATAVIYAPFGDSVFTVVEQPGADGQSRQVARQKFVRLGERRGDRVAVESGLEAGETIVSAGAFKLRNGAPVVIRNDLALPAAAGRSPAEP